MAETRAALLRAGAELFATRGLDVPSLDDICAAAGYTRGAFYVHFRDRDAFVDAVMESFAGPLLDALFQANEGDQPPGLADVVARFATAVANDVYPFTRPGGVRPHQLIDACLRSPAIRKRYVGLVHDAIARLAKVVEADQARGGVRADADPRLLATTLMAAVIGAQTMLELGANIDVGASGADLLRWLGEAPLERQPPLVPRSRPRTRRV